MSLACGYALYSSWNHKITLNSLDCVGKSWRALDMTSESECEINPKQLNASLKRVYLGVHSGPTAIFFFFYNYLLQGAFSFFWDRVSRLVLNSQYPWLSLISAGITPSLASERALLPEGTPPFAEYSLTCCAVALGSLHSTACLKLTLVPMMNLDPRFHTRMHMPKNKTTKPPWLWKFHVLWATWGPLFSVLRRWLAPSVFPPLVTPNFPSSSHHFVIGPTRWQDPFNF